MFALLVTTGRTAPPIYVWFWRDRRCGRFPVERLGRGGHKFGSQGRDQRDRCPTSGRPGKATAVSMTDLQSFNEMIRDE